MSTISSGTTSTTTLVHSGDTTGSLVFKTNDTGSGGTTAMTIDTSQKVGIGTTSPSSPLQVATAGVNTTVQISSTDANGGYGAVLSFKNTGTGGREYWIDSTSNSDGDVGGGKFKFYDATAGATRMLIDSSGNLLVGTSSTIGASSAGTIHAVTQSGTKPALFLRNGNASAGNYWQVGPDGGGNTFTVFNQSGTGVYVSNGGTSWTANSDERVKENLIPITDGLNKVASLRAVTGNLINDETKASRAFLIAQDVQKVLPEAVMQRDDEIGTLGLAYTDVIPLLVASIKELKALVDAQATEIAELKAKVG